VGVGTGCVDVSQNLGQPPHIPGAAVLGMERAHEFLGSGKVGGRMRIP
jgi:hypothetical protein